jgi:NitT/TauT family transport system permease protein/taurine transport system permease protein
MCASGLRGKALRSRPTADPRLGREPQPVRSRRPGRAVQFDAENSLGIAFAFRSRVDGEMIASTDGIGYAIFNAQQYFQSARIVVGMLAIGIAWLLMDRFVLRPIEQRTTMRWGLMREGIENV